MLIHPPSYPAYPPYHKGDYLEERWYHHQLNGVATSRTYLPISWTNLYMEGRQGEIQKYLDSLDPNLAYYAVCIADDAPCQNLLPKNTLVFSAGGKYKSPLNVAIPLGVIPHGFPVKEKDIFASFVGSMTHKCREEMLDILRPDPRVLKMCKSWTINVPSNAISIFMDTMARSKFTLCPRGYGYTSFRFYEALQLDSVPIYYSDEHYLPMADIIDYSKFSLLATKENLKSVIDAAYNMDEGTRKIMVDYGRTVFEKHFMYDGVLRYIQTYLETEKQV